MGRLTRQMDRPVLGFHSCLGRYFEADPQQVNPLHECETVK